MNGSLTSLEDSEFDVSVVQDKAVYKSRRLSLDDAFSESGEEPHSDFTINELAKTIHATRSWISHDDDLVDDIQLEPSFEDPDASVSTIDIDTPHTPNLTANPTSISLPSSPDSQSSQLTDSGKGSNYVPYAVDGNKVSEHTEPSSGVDGEPQYTAHENATLPGTHTHAKSDILLVSNSSTTAASKSSQAEKVSPSRASIPVSNSFPTNSLTPRPLTHRQTKSTGPSALEKVISRTRPSYLPPKTQNEDKKHLADWEAMMKQSRMAEDHRRKIQEERRLVRERHVEESLSIWEKQILPDWKTAVRTESLRKVWWNGIPPKLRGFVWENAIGNALALSKDNYRACLARASRALTSGKFPTTTLHLIDEDIRTTLPSLHIFTPSSGPLYQDLKDMLCAWMVTRSDEGLGYVTGASKIAAMFLLNMHPPNAFVAMRNLLERHCLRSFYGGLAAKDDVEAYYRIFDTLLADYMPKIYFNFKQHQVPPAAYLPDWLLPLFLNHLPLEACARLWDVLILEGDSFLFRAALAILGFLESRLFFPDKQELVNLLRGENKASIDVAKRDGRLLGICKYEIYGIEEETLWEEITTLQEWWKENTWTRLIQRELPDI